MKTYELTYIITSEITSEEAEARAKELESAVSRIEGSILRQANPSAKTLSYPVEGRASGFFGVIEFQAEPEKIPELKTFIEKDEKIIRHIIVIKKPQKMRPERRTRTKPVSTEEPIFNEKKKLEENVDLAEKAEERPTVKAKSKEKVELKDIEHELDEILG